MKLEGNVLKVTLEETKNIYITSDTHFGHKNIIKYANRPFDSVDQMGNKLLANLNSIPNDATLIIAGDFSFQNGLQLASTANAIKVLNKYLVLGNHDVRSRCNSVFKVFPTDLIINIDDVFTIRVSHYPYYKGMSIFEKIKYIVKVVFTLGQTVEHKIRRIKQRFKVYSKYPRPNGEDLFLYGHTHELGCELKKGKNTPIQMHIGIDGYFYYPHNLWEILCRVRMFTLRSNR